MQRESFFVNWNKGHYLVQLKVLRIGSQTLRSFTKKTLWRRSIQSSTKITGFHSGTSGGVEGPDGLSHDYANFCQMTLFALYLLGYGGGGGGGGLYKLPYFR